MGNKHGKKKKREETEIEHEETHREQKTEIWRGGNYEEILRKAQINSHLHQKKSTKNRRLNDIDLRGKLTRIRVNQETTEYYDSIELISHGLNSTRLNAHFNIEEVPPHQLFYLEKSSLMVFTVYSGRMERSEIVVYHFSLSNEYVCERFVQEDYGRIDCLSCVKEISPEEFIFISFISRYKMKWIYHAIIVDIRKKPFTKIEVAKNRYKPNGGWYDRNVSMCARCPRFCAISDRQFIIFSISDLCIFSISLVPTLTLSSRRIIEKTRLKLLERFRHTVNLYNSAVDEEVQYSLRIMKQDCNSDVRNKIIYFSRHYEFHQIFFTLKGKKNETIEKKKLLPSQQQQKKIPMIEEEEEEEEEDCIGLEREEEETEGEIIEKKTPLPIDNSSKLQSSGTLKHEGLSLPRHEKNNNNNNINNNNNYYGLFGNYQNNYNYNQQQQEEEEKEVVKFSGFFHFSKENYKKYPYKKFSLSNRTCYAVIKSKKSIFFVNVSHNNNKSNNSHNNKKPNFEFQRYIGVDEKMRIGDSVLIRSDLNRILFPLVLKKGEEQQTYFNNRSRENLRERTDRLAGINIVHFLDESLSLSRTQFIDSQTNPVFNFQGSNKRLFCQFFLKTRHDDDRFGVRREKNEKKKKREKEEERINKLLKSVHVYNNNNSIFEEEEEEEEEKNTTNETQQHIIEEAEDKERFAILFKDGAISSWKIVCQFQNLGYDEKERLMFISDILSGNINDDEKYEEEEEEGEGEDVIGPEKVLFLTILVAGHSNIKIPKSYILLS